MCSVFQPENTQSSHALFHSTSISIQKLLEMQAIAEELIWSIHSFHVDIFKEINLAYTLNLTTPE